MTQYYPSRINEIKGSIKRKGLECFLITDINNVRYLTGFSGSSAILLITVQEAFFITDFRYKEQSEKEVKEWEIITGKGDLVKTIQNLLKKTGIKKLGFESSVTYKFFAKLSDTGIKLKALEGFIERLREIKNTFEIKKIKEAVRRAENAFLEIKPYIRQGMRERAIALRLEERLKKKGCLHIPFEVIVASGPNSSMPHAKPTDRKINKSDLVIIDWGGEADGYFSDMTRTLLVKGDNINEKKEIYQIVLKANKKAISRVLPGVKSEDIDFSAREVIKKAGYGEFFGHGTGHGVGIQIHELPRISWDKKNIIKENMVFTIEPGIYVPGVGGVRIEDMVAVKPEGYRVLTSLPKKLEIIG
ncbi:MAG: Xaa-Pro peptidase family protein [Nitrospirota bacterium]